MEMANLPTKLVVALNSLAVKKGVPKREPVTSINVSKTKRLATAMTRHTIKEEK